jgi:hypothetical protein
MTCNFIWKIVHAMYLNIYVQGPPELSFTGGVWPKALESARIYTRCIKERSEMCSRCSFCQQIDCTHQRAYLSFEFFPLRHLMFQNPHILSGYGRSRHQKGAPSTPFDSSWNSGSGQHLRAPVSDAGRSLAPLRAFGQKHMLLTKGARKRSPMFTCSNERSDMCTRYSFCQGIDCTHQRACLPFEFLSFRHILSQNTPILSGSGGSRHKKGAPSTPFDSS